MTGMLCTPTPSASNVIVMCAMPVAAVIMNAEKDKAEKNLSSKSIMPSAPYSGNSNSDTSGDTTPYVPAGVFKDAMREIA